MWSWVQVRARGLVTAARLCRGSHGDLRNGPWSVQQGRWVTRWLSLVRKYEKSLLVSLVL